TRSPKLVPAGVLTGLVVPLKVIVVVPLTPAKFTTLVPLILKTPVVVKVTGSALVDVAIDAMNPASRKGMSSFLNRISICVTSVSFGHPYDFECIARTEPLSTSHLRERTALNVDRERPGKGHRRFALF